MESFCNREVDVVFICVFYSGYYFLGYGNCGVYCCFCDLCFEIIFLVKGMLFFLFENCYVKNLCYYLWVERLSIVFVVGCVLGVCVFSLF